MYNLFRFLVRYHLFILFLLAEILCIYLIYQNNRYNRVVYWNAASEGAAKVYSVYKGVTDYFYLRQYSDSLVMENARLRAMLLESKYDQRIDSGYVSDSSKRYVQNYTYLTARVIRNTVNQPVNYVYIDKGSAQGIQKQMGVISPSGIVGQVVGVTEHYAAVMSVLSKDFRVSVKFKKNEYFGNIHWTGNSTTTAVLEEIPKHVPVKVGDTLVTSGYSQLFPRNVMVGTVKTVKAEPEKNFQDITVNLSTGFGNLGYVYVVSSMSKKEIQQLDSITTKPNP